MYVAPSSSSCTSTDNGHHWNARVVLAKRKMSLVRVKALLCVCLLSVLEAVSSPVVAHAESYRLQPGDVLSLMVVGAPDLTRPVPVEMDGTAWFPLVGALSVGGSSLDQVRQQVSQAYAATILPATIGGDRVPVLIQANQVAVSIEEYSPVYLTGDVVAPRAIPYRPGLTLRQVIALAGSGAAPQGSPIAAQANIEAALVELGRAYARIWSLKKELGKDSTDDYQRIFVADTPAIRELAELERSMNIAKIAELNSEKSRIAEGVDRAEKRLLALEAQKANEEAGSQLDQKIASDVRELFTRGSPLAPASKLAEVQRSALVSASRVLELEVAAENVRTELADLRAQQATVQAGDQSEILDRTLGCADACAEQACEADHAADRLCWPSGGGPPGAGCSGWGDGGL